MLYVNLLIIILCNNTPTLNMLLITLSFTKNDIIIIAVTIIYDIIFFFALSFFFNIGTFSVSACAYNYIIIIANVSIIAEKII